MKAYKRVPTWWYVVSYVALLALAIGFVEGYHTGVRWWFIIVIMVIHLVTIIPIAIMSALCNQIISLSALGEFIGGGLYAGNMEAAVIAKVRTPTWFVQASIDSCMLKYNPGSPLCSSRNRHFSS
jgi:OPT oligopeptide transporter protein